MRPIILDLKDALVGVVLLRGVAVEDEEGVLLALAPPEEGVLPAAAAADELEEPAEKINTRKKSQDKQIRLDL